MDETFAIVLQPILKYFCNLFNKLKSGLILSEENRI